MKTAIPKIKTPSAMRTVIGYLADTEPKESPLISCFAHVSEGVHLPLAEIDARANQIGKQLRGERRADYLEALQRVRETLLGPLKPTTRSVAVFARGGDYPMLFPVEFEVEMPTRFIVDDLPHIYPLVELKDTYHRFVIVITTEEDVRIMETSIGAVSEQIFASRPELRKRIGREWTREHYQNHKRERERKFLKEKISVVEDLMERRGHNHLVLAGSPKMMAMFTKELPERLQKQIVSVVSSNPKNGITPILLESIAQFVEAETAESHDRATQLESAVLSGGLGVAGIEATTNALNDGYADMLVIDQDFDIPEIRESLVRLATRKNVPIETVSDCAALKRLAGVGCLLRYKPAGI